MSAAVKGDNAFISVTDNGRGIPPKDLPVLFDKFHRGRPAPHSKAMRDATDETAFLEDADVSGVGLGLYLAKMRDGRFDKVYNLRKGDQLVDFYEHFKVAHAGVVKMQKDDIDRAKAVIAAAEAAGAGEHEAVSELRELVARKEKSLE